MKKKLQIKSLILTLLSFAFFINTQTSFSQTAVTPPNLTTKNWHIQNVSTGQRIMARVCDNIADDIKLVESTEVSECAQYQFKESSTAGAFLMINRSSTAGHIAKNGCDGPVTDQKIRQVSGDNDSACTNWIFKDSDVDGQYRIENVAQGTWMSSADPNFASTKVRLVPNTVMDDTTLWVLVEEGTTLSDASNQFEISKVYPNPVHDILNIDNVKDSNFNTIKVYDILGKEVLDTPFTKTLNLGKLRKGIYFLRLFSNTDTSLNQVIKIHKL